MKEKLIHFLLWMNEQDLINNHDFDYEETATKFLNSTRPKKISQLYNENGYDIVKTYSLYTIYSNKNLQKVAEIYLNNECFDITIGNHKEQKYLPYEKLPKLMRNHYLSIALDLIKSKICEQ